ncbi:germination protein, Ger(x)C family [Thermosyntropha lipolytica DSM 11003]|uniref:Germination protein, Ger(X)C family n=1 Tax=Thermosyntropha lipolytica DSM 11003 TaxID=1123382 RepID=A0A1M5JTJ3_9FIRM|nr:Ger(x)C family spore germination protein [Thermosyntropha lipolytica]SHG43303.1 germination protein, Ger(x)C family [Thermosyntropha lipolytica DSM 11003]
MRSKPVLLLIPIIFSLFLIGCETRDINNTAAVLSIGVEEEKGQIKLSVQIAKPSAPGESGNEDSEPQFLVLTETGESLVQAARKINLTLPRMPLWTYTNTILVSEKLAFKDINFLIDTVSRNPNVRKNSSLVIAHKTSPEKILQIKPPLEPFPAQAIVNILDIQEKVLGIYTPVSLGDFIKRASAPGIEPLVPQITAVNKGGKELFMVNGSAVFLGTRMVGHFNEEESRGYRFIYPGTKKGGIINVPSPVNPQNLMTLEFINITTQAKAEVREGQIIVKIKVNSEGNFYEQTGSENLLTFSRIKDIEKATEAEIKRQMNLSIRQAQKLKADVFGWGKLVENDYPYFWKEIAEDWPEIFPRVKPQIEVKFKLRRTYLTDKSFVSTP